MTDRAELLRGVDLFSLLEDKALNLIAEKSRLQNYKKGEVVFLEDDSENDSLFIIAKGQVKVFVTGVDGKEAILALLNDGEFFGEMSLLDGEPRSASVKATETTKLVILKRESFFEVLKSSPDVTMSLLIELSKRLRKSDKQISSLALMTVFGRIASTLELLVDEQGFRTKLGNGKSALVIRNRPSHQQLADMSGTTRETVSRVLTDLHKKGSIALCGKDLFVLENSGLNVTL